MEEIRNRVEESGLIQLDLAQFKPSLEICEIDIACALWQGLILKEKEFRTWVREHHWQQYNGKAVCVFSSADAIIPTWAFMLVASQLTGVASFYQIGSRVELEKMLIKQNIEQLNLSELIEGRIIIKGCSDIAAPEFAMSELIKRIQPIANGIMYGEPCSSVPIFKRRQSKFD
jgi:hypothetical protein